MIVPMKKLSLLIYHREKERFLQSLQELGVVHVEVKPEVSSEQLTRFQEKQRQTKRILSRMAIYSKKSEKLSQQPGSKQVEEIITDYEKLIEKKEQLVQEIGNLRKQEQIVKPWGEYDPSIIEKLRKAGLTLRFFEVSKRTFEEMDLTEVRIFCVPVQDNRVRFVVCDYGDGKSISAEEITLPPVSLTSIQNRIGQCENECSEIDSELRSLSTHRETIAKELASLECEEHEEKIHLSFEGGAQGHVVSLCGWFPAEKQAAITTALDNKKVWYDISNPGKGDSIPVHLRNNAFTRLFAPITKIFQLPNYFELDPTFAIAPFFAIFFGNCLGDAGYGLLILLLCTILSMKIRGTALLFIRLGQVLGIATTLMGIVNSGVFFGLSFSDYPSFPLFSFLQTFAIIKEGVMINPFNFALLLGVIQMNFGMILNIYNSAVYGSPKQTIPGIGRILLVDGCILLFLIVYQKLAVLQPLRFPATLAVVCGFLCLVYVAFFTKLDEYLGNPFADLLLKLYFVLSGAVGDVLSYIRLFALGLSSGVLGYVVNVIALQIRDGIPYVGWFIFIVFLIGGHAGNLVLAALGSFVHPLRLTFVEFYNNLAFKGGGIEYKPFKNLNEGSTI